MSLTGQFAKIAGACLLLLVACQVAALLLTSGADGNPLEKDEIAKLLEDIHDNERLFALGGMFSLAVDAILSIAVAAVVYLLFRRREPVLATLGMLLIVGASVAFIVADSANLAMLFVADDFINGGAEGIAPGSESALELGRILYLFAGVIFEAASVALAAGFIAAGSVISFAPAGAGATPPRWIGWPALLAGILVIASPIIFVAVDAGTALYLAGMSISLVWLVLLGGWLLLSAPDDVMVA